MFLMFFEHLWPSVNQVLFVSRWDGPRWKALLAFFALKIWTGRKIPGVGLPFLDPKMVKVCWVGRVVYISFPGCWREFARSSLNKLSWFVQTLCRSHLTIKLLPSRTVPLLPCVKLYVKWLWHRVVKQPKDCKNLVKNSKFWEVLISLRPF